MDAISWYVPQMLYSGQAKAWPAWLLAMAILDMIAC